MLKGFVSGEEKDIKRIPMKGKNLFDVGSEKTISDRFAYACPLSIGQKYTFTNCSGYVLGFKISIWPTAANSIQVISMQPNESYTFTMRRHPDLPEGATQYFFIIINGVYGQKVNGGDIMLNAGDTPLPYEPYGYQEGWEVRDNQDRLIWGREDELQTATGTLPFKGYALPLKVKSLLGNAVQNGTPAPDNIVMPEMCGKLIGTDWTIPLTNAGQNIPIYLGEVPTVRRVRKLVLTGEETIAGSTLSGGWIVTNLPINMVNTTGVITAICSHYKAVSNASMTALTVGDMCISTNSTNRINFATDISTAADFKAYLAAQYQAGTPVTIWYVLANEQTGIVSEPLAKIGDYADELTTIQVHGLSAPLYGIGDYKDTLNLSTGVVTRKVKKLVLTGGNTETWGKSQSTNTFYLTGTPDASSNRTLTLCSHFAYSGSTKGESGTYYTPPTASHQFNFTWVDSASLDDWKSYLAAQYQNGTPVTVWYVLSTPTTETVTVPTGMTGEIEGRLTQVSTPTPTNRSVPKWNGEEETGGTYAVTVYTPPEIPTTTGENTLTVDTTLAPSSLTVKGHIKELT